MRPTGTEDLADSGLRARADNTTGAIVSVDRDGRISDFNAGAERDVWLRRTRLGRRALRHAGGTLRLELSLVCQENTPIWARPR